MFTHVSSDVNGRESGAKIANGINRLRVNILQWPFSITNRLNANIHEKNEKFYGKMVVIREKKLCDYVKKASNESKKGRHRKKTFWPFSDCGRPFQYIRQWQLKSD